MYIWKRQKKVSRDTAKTSFKYTLVFPKYFTYINVSPVLTVLLPENYNLCRVLFHVLLVFIGSVSRDFRLIFFPNSKPSGPLTNRLKYFRIRLLFCRDSWSWSSNILAMRREECTVNHRSQNCSFSESPLFILQIYSPMVLYTCSPIKGIFLIVPFKATRDQRGPILTP